MRSAFKEYIQGIGLESMQVEEERVQKYLDKGAGEWAWGQLLVTMKFWMDDISPNFEKTDLFIEKSLATSFALLDRSTYEKVMDLGKFLFKEKIMAR